jgi:hypothetical protein
VNTLYSLLNNNNNINNNNNNNNIFYLIRLWNLQLNILTKINLTMTLKCRNTLLDTV